MKIKILNKNLNHPEEEPLDYSDVKIYNIDEAPVLTEVKNETLDSAVVVISNQSNIINLEPYDIVELLEDDEITRIKYMCVDTYTETLTCVSPKIYRYEISLFSETKQLEGIVLPNLKITKVFGQTRNIFYYIDQYMREYSPQIRLVYSSTYGYGNKWNWLYDDNNNGVPDLEEKFSDECPEMQWNTPTLREVLNDLMMVKDCIPILKNCRLEFMDLTKVNTKDWTSDTTHLNYVTKSKSSEDYVSELQCKLENVTNNSKGVNNLVTRIEYCHLNAPDNEAVLTTNNILLKTQYPIYNLKSVTIMFPGEGINYGSGGSPTIYTKKWMGANLMELTIPNTDEHVNLVTEYKEWITKPIKYNSAPPALRDWPKYQNYSLYYVRGSNEINNLGNIGKWTLIFTSTWVFWEALISVIINNFSPTGTFDTKRLTDWYNLFFKIEYETLDGCLFRASKSEYPNNERTIIDNQTNSYVDSYNQGFMEYQKANRLGNEQLQINARFLSSEIANIMKIGDMYDDCVIYQCQYQWYKNHIEVNALATKNYILREYFTGVKSKIRSWAIASGSEALTRHDLVKYYCEFSWKPHSETHGLETLFSNPVDNYLTTPLQNYDAHPLITCFIRTSDGVNSYPPNYSSGRLSYYNIDLISRIIGNSLVFTFALQDNYWVGQSFHTETDFNGSTPISGDKYIELSDIKWDPNGVLTYVIDNSALSGGGVPMYQHKYANEYGEYTQLEVILAYGSKLLIRNQRDYQIGDDLEESPYESDRSYLYNIYQKPRVSQFAITSLNETDYDYEKIRVISTHHKDSQEIINFSTQFEFCSDTTDISVGKEWMNKQQSMSLNDNNINNYKLIAYNKSVYNFRNPSQLPSSGYQTEGNIDTITDHDEITIEWLHDFINETAAQDALNSYCFYLNDGDATSSKVLLAFNNIKNVEITMIDENKYHIFFTLYLNILRNRNKNIYDDENRYLIVGKI